MTSTQHFGQGRSLLLTFDDGPEPGGALESILSTLAQHGISSEFYVIGMEVKNSPEKAKSIVTRGHKIQNHSWSHINLATAPEAEVRSQVEKTQAAIKDATGITATKVRPPYGAGGWPKKYDPELAHVAAALSLKIENWDIDTEDWKAPQGIGEPKIENVHRQLLASKLSRLIVLMHVQPGTARDLPHFIAKLKGWGFAFARP
ncbi:MAG TPA: polysaccharide deacetylase family protein [Polyangiaceae bacterium]|jgi:peptidoglycan/xylan/chitin deacetylase (PgdA/CDA1 family)